MTGACVSGIHGDGSPGNFGAAVCNRESAANDPGWQAEAADDWFHGVFEAKQVSMIDCVEDSEECVRAPADLDRAEVETYLLIAADAEEVAAPIFCGPLSGPDPGQARALAGAHGGRAVLAVCTDSGCTELGQIIQADLARIGIRIQLRPYAGAIASATTRPGADIVLARVFAPYPDPAAFLKAALGGRFAQDRLAALTGLDRSQRLTAAGQLEFQLMRGPAPLAAIGTPVIPEFFSARVSCHIFQPLEFGADLGSLCLD
jgi:hypothetical protein